MIEFVVGLLVGAPIGALIFDHIFVIKSELTLPSRLPNESMQEYAYRLSKEATMKEAEHK